MFRTLTCLMLGLTLSPGFAEDDAGSYQKYNLSTRLPVLSVAVSPDGKTAALAVGDASVRTWDLEKGEELARWKAHEHPAIHRTVYTPDGKSLFTCCENGDVRQWDSTSGKQLREFKGHSVAVKSLTASPDGKKILTAGSDATLRSFDVATGKLERTMRIGDGDAEAPFRSVAIIASGQRVIAGNAKGHVGLWNLTNGKQINVFTEQEGEVTALAFLPDGKEFVSAADNVGEIKLQTLANGKVTRTLRGHTKGVNSLDLSADGKRLVSASADGSIRVWNLNTAKEIAQLAENKKGVTQAVFLGNQRVVSCSEDGSMIVWTLPR